MYYQQSAASVLKALKTDATTGLSHLEAEKRLSKYGHNLLPVKKKPPVIFKFFSQFKNTLVLILLAATLIALILGDKLDALAIFAIVILNATIGFIQEIQAEKTLDALSEKDILYTLVLRDSQVEKIPTSEVTVGDILILEEGGKMPADARIIEAFSLHADESILTGESQPVAKNAEELPAGDIPLSDRVNLVFKETQISSGRGKAVVLAVGSETEFGKIALYLEETRESKSPLTKELDKVGRSLTIVIGIIATVIFFLNYTAKLSFVDSLLVSISLAVAAIPEGLPAIVTIVLSLGVKRLALKKTIVKKLPAVETLGAVRIIATDKTGTLTQNKINVVKIITNEYAEFAVEGEGYSPEGVFFDNNKKIIDPAKYRDLEKLLKAGVYANNASLNTQTFAVLGDTTEAALLVAAARAKLDITQLKNTDSRIYEVPFSSERKMMSVIVRVDETSDHLLYSKGAPEILLSKCNLSEKEKQEILEQTKIMAKDGLRSLAIAVKKLDKNEVKKALEEENLDEGGLTYLGVVGMQDPLRPEVANAIAQAKEAGIRTIMITGDHKETAETIASACGITTHGKNIVLTENDLSRMSDEQLIREIRSGVNVFARISPFTKLRIIEAIKRIPNTQVAVTGDGVNDAPAISAADIGVAMGKSGTDVTREVADIVITDDNYATIVVAVEEGRIIYANLVKFIRYLISCNLSEVIVITAAVAIGTPLPLLPIQILWINLITDGLPALALGVDPPEYDVMKKPPRDLTEGILHKKRWAYMTVEGLIMGISVFMLFVYALNNHSYAEAQTMAFAALALSQLVHAFNNRSTRRSLFKVGIFTNKYLIVTVVISTVLQILTIQTGWGNFVFKTVSLELNHWMLIGLVSLIPFLVVEIKKQLRFRILP